MGARGPHRRRRDSGWTAGIGDLARHALEFVVRQFFELTAIEARVPLDAALVDVGGQAVLAGRHCDVTNRQQEVLRPEPAARIHDDVVRTSGRYVDDDTVDDAEPFSRPPGAP